MINSTFYLMLVFAFSTEAIMYTIIYSFNNMYNYYKNKIYVNKIFIVIKYLNFFYLIIHIKAISYPFTIIQLYLYL